MEQRLQFVMEWKKGASTMTALCRAFGITRPTGCKWVARYYEDGDEGDVMLLEDRPRRPLHSPHAVSELVEDLIVRARKMRPQYGPRKLRAWLEDLGHRGLPAASTIGEVLKRNGLTRPRRYRRRTPACTQP